MRLFSRPHFTLHVRLTRDCNAHCSYCSSAGAQEGRMSPLDFARATQWIAEHVFPQLGVGPHHHLTIEYLGGEVLLIPQDELEANVAHARRLFGAHVGRVRDGAQSNLIGSPRRVEDLVALFEGRIGTSWDPHSGQRHIRGNAALYTGILNRSLRALDAQGLRPGRVFVVDAHTSPHLAQEVDAAAQGGYDLVLRPVFQGGSPSVERATLAVLEAAFMEGYRAWKMSGRAVRVEPYATLYERRQAAQGGVIHQGGQGCPFQADCAFRSLSLDPNGDLFVCQEMADSGHFQIGNALEGVFEEATWKRLAMRQRHLDESCQRCPWIQSCGGGCMNEAIARFGDPFAKTELCRVWQALFRAIDTDLAEDSAAPSLAPELV